MEILSYVAVAVIVGATAYALLRKALLSLAYAIAILAVFIIDAVSIGLAIREGNPFAPVVRIELGLLYTPGAFPDPWTWVTFQFVHGSSAHVLLNLLGLVLISPVFEERVGRAAWALLFLAGGMVGAALFLALNAGRDVFLLGASAGVFSVFGAYGRLYPKDRVRLFLPLPGIPALPVMQVVIGFLVIEMVLSLVGPPGIAWEAHVGGLLFGLAVAPFARALGGRRRAPAKAPSYESLRDLATTRELEEILREMRAADLPEVREAWLEQFIRAARCPECGGPLRRRLGRISSDCGWRRPLP